MNDRVAVIGDYMLDIDTNLTQVKIAPDCHVPVGVLKDAGDEVIRPGGAGAVVEMLKGFNIETIAVGENIKQKCVKHRFFVNGKPFLRKDIDYLDVIDTHECCLLMEQIPSDVEYIIVSDYGKGVITEQLWKILISLGKKLIVDPTIHKPLTWYKGAYAIIPNAKEADVDCVDNAFVRVEWLINYYQNVCIKLGAQGMVLKEQNRAAHHIIPLLITPVDVCGAGDMVIAAITAALTIGLEWYYACVFANKMAAKKCLQMGSTAINEPISLLSSQL